MSVVHTVISCRLVQKQKKDRRNKEDNAEQRPTNSSDKTQANHQVPRTAISMESCSLSLHKHHQEGGGSRLRVGMHVVLSVVYFSQIGTGRNVWRCVEIETTGTRGHGATALVRQDPLSSVRIWRSSSSNGGNETKLMSSRWYMQYGAAMAWGCISYYCNLPYRYNRC